jgi:DnaJ-class molecular chaperone
MEKTMSKDLIMMPTSLTAENGAKGLLSGEFSETVIIQCEECEGHGILEGQGSDDVCSECDGAGDYALKVPIAWTTIKDIYAKVVEHFENKLDKCNKNKVR